MPEIPLFRFNIDLWRDYRWSIGPDDFELEDPTGRVCHQRSVRAVYLRKLLFSPPLIDIPAGGSEEHWCREEVTQVWLGLRDWAHETGRLALVKPSPRGRWNKIRQMKVAASFFPVPNWRIVHRSPVTPPSPVVVKTMGASNVGGGSLVTVREVDPQSMAPDYPWFLQHKLTDATHDVTVAWVAGKQYAFEADRSQFAGDDVRTATFDTNLPWTPATLSADESSRIDAFMRATGLDFGRLDFLRSDGNLWFLEVNPNGQFAWLDPEGRFGLLDAVADEIRRVWQSNG